MGYITENAAAVEYVNEVGYDGSVDALAVKQAFLAGALSEGAADDLKLVEAFIAGMRWNKGVKDTARQGLRTLLNGE